jgi:hypothetical protein
MVEDEDAESEMLAKRVKHILHCFHELNVDDGVTALEVIGISVDKESVPYVERSLMERKMSRFGGIIGTVLPFKHL